MVLTRRATTMHSNVAGHRLFEKVQPILESLFSISSISVNTSLSKGFPSSMMSLSSSCRTHISAHWVQRTAAKRLLSSLMQSAVLDSKQGDSLRIKCNIPSIAIEVTSSWQEHCDIAFCKSIRIDVMGGQRPGSGREFTISLCRTDIDSTITSDAPPMLKMIIPEMFNIAIQADDAIINFRKKILGDVSVECNTGHVSIDQLRGEHISLQCNEAHVEVHKKLEGCLSLSCSSLTAQMIHGNSVDISSRENVTIKALYSVNSSISSSGGSVHVGLSHGHTAINSSLGCTLSGIDGSFVVNSNSGGAILQINKLYPGSESMAISQLGSITTLLDPEVITKLYCSTRSDRALISVESDGFEASQTTSSSCEGVFSGQSSALKRPLVSSSKFKRKSGKINIESAALLSLRNTIKSDGISSSEDPSPSPKLPSLSLIAKSGVVVESVSWIGKIMKKYDM